MTTSPSSSSPPPPSSLLSEQDCQEILTTYVSLSRRRDQQVSFELTKLLTEEEREVAACAGSHAYWVATQRYPHILRNNNNNNNSFRFATAQREAFRHTDGVPEFDEALKLLKATIEFHVTKRTNLYRMCFGLDAHTMNNNNTTTTTDADTTTTTLSLIATRSARIRYNLQEVQPMLIRGHDIDKQHAIWTMLPRRSRKKQQQQNNNNNNNSSNNNPDDIEGFVDTLIYIVQRAAACTEYLTRGHNDRIIAIADSKGSTAPSIPQLRAAIAVLQNHYPGRLQRLAVLDLPYWIDGTYRWIKPFLDPDTSAKFVLVRGQTQKEAALKNIVTPNQAPPEWLTNGQLSSSQDIDMEKYLYRVPFHRLYDDEYEYDDHDDNTTTTNTTACSNATTSCNGSTTTTTTGATRAKSLAVGSLTECLSGIEGLRYQQYHQHTRRVTFMVGRSP